MENKVVRQAKAGKFFKKEEYLKTVENIPEGETHYFAAIGTTYTSLAAACSRLRRRGWGVDFSLNAAERRIYITVARKGE